MKKGCPKTRPEKTSKIDWNLFPKWDGLGSENERFAGDLLQNKGFRWILKYWENWCQKGSKKRPKSEPKTIRDQIFEIFGRFGWSRYLDGFWERKKWTENQENGGRRRSRGTLRDGVGGGGGARWGFGVWRFLRFARFAERFQHAVPALPRGRGRRISKCLRQNSARGRWEWFLKVWHSKGAKREPKGATREPKGAKREPKIKKIIKNHTLERSKFSFYLALIFFH